jgi:hypothetical protein
MKNINRWALMRNTRSENICEHSQDVAVLAHGLAVLQNARFSPQVDAGRCVLLAMYHDAPEIFTGDLPTPVKHGNPAIEKAYRAGKVNFCKPVSCALYPIRVGDYGPYKAVNYHRWSVCKAAVLLGKKENLPVYKFLKEPLIRKFGQAWYAELEIAAEELKNRGLIE